MGGPWLRSAMAARWLLWLLLGLAGHDGVLQVHGQVDSLGFISIDCGMPESASGYVDNGTKLSFVSDAGFIDAGTNYNMSAAFITPSTGKTWHSVRSFAGPGAGARNCYTLRSLVPGLKYLIRASFMYGNYDGLNQPPVFDLHLGVDYWTTVNVSDADTAVILEATAVVPAGWAQVCLVDTGSGTPFISSLAVRPLKNSLYHPMVNATQGLVLLSRANLSGPSDPHLGFRHQYYNVSINATATANSTLPHILNALEIFSVVPTTGVPTAAQDVSSITAIRDKYRLKKNWMGDPCVPKNFAWNGLGCSYAVSIPPSVTGLNLSSSGLSGNLSSSFASLRGLKYLDLSHNNLTGTIPETFSQLSSLRLIDLTGNQFSGSIPPGLLKKMQDGSLTLRYGNNPNLCTNSDSCQPLRKKKSSKVAIYIAVSTVAILMIVLLSVLLLLLSMLRRRQGTTSRYTIRRPNKVSNGLSHSRASDEHISLLCLDNRQFSYAELEAMTNGFSREIGEGGFGKVYSGSLEDGTQVAVKLLSESSVQGVQEFLAEAQTLAKIHHKNLVSLIGYCKDREYMALVYKYMSEGSLHEHLIGRGNKSPCLTWRQRLRIALESAQGLEYLHKGCNPPLIHRDVKTSNILLNANLEAKIADFGLLKAFNSSNDTHLSTARLIGTPGYISPEYHATLQLTNKSDVYSFGVVLLEMVIGKSPILNNPLPTSLINWVQQRLAHGNIESVVEARMCTHDDVNSVQKFIDTALKCTATSPEQRPTMTDVVVQLLECLELEVARCEANGGFYSVGSSDNPSEYSGYDTDMSTDVSQSSTASEMEHFNI